MKGGVEEGEIMSGGGKGCERRRKEEGRMKEERERCCGGLTCGTSLSFLGSSKAAGPTASSSLEAWWMICSSSEAVESLSATL